MLSFPSVGLTHHVPFKPVYGRKEHEVSVNLCFLFGFLVLGNFLYQFRFTTVCVFQPYLIIYKDWLSLRPWAFIDNMICSFHLHTCTRCVVKICFIHLQGFPWPFRLSNPSPFIIFFQTLNMVWVLWGPQSLHLILFLPESRVSIHQPLAGASWSLFEILASKLWALSKSSMSM